MEAYIVDWLNLFVRWLHLITGIAWIGASFYFVMLDSSLKSPKKAEDTKRGVHGELWAVHGGGFYCSQKFLTGPKGEPLSQDLHWSKWEAYTTWLTGIFLLGLIYWYSAEIYLIDPNVMALSKPVAIGISIVFLVGGWIGYDQLCKSKLGNSEAKLGAVMFALVAIAAFVLCHIYSGRGAYIMFGAMLGTIMVANVFFVIIPGQKKMVEAIHAGQEPDPEPGRQGKQRSVHNTYFTLPVLFVMISNHYAMTYGHEYNWLLLIAIALAGALIRVFFVSRHSAGSPNYVAAAAAVVLLAIVVTAIMPRPVATPAATTGSDKVEAVSFTAVESIVAQRCTVCHGSNPTQPGFNAPPKGIVYDTPEQIHAQAAIIHQQAVVSKAMPIGNLTGMTEEERALISAWFKQFNN